MGEIVPLVVEPFPESPLGDGETSQRRISRMTEGHGEAVPSYQKVGGSLGPR